MHDLTPITALGGTAPRVDTVAGLTLTENPDLALASVAARRGHEATCSKHLTKLLGAPAPGPGHAHLGDPLAAVWIGPDHWMIGAPFESHEELADDLKTALGDAASVTEQTDAWACFDLSGTGIEAVLELCCPLNIRTMQMGEAQRTTIHHLACYVVCGDPKGFVRLLTPRASAGSFHHAVLTAMKAAL